MYDLYINENTFFLFFVKLSFILYLLIIRNLKTALHYAVDGSHNNAVKMLLEGNWGDVNSVDSKGWTPLMRAGKYTKYKNNN